MLPKTTRPESLLKMKSNHGNPECSLIVSPEAQSDIDDILQYTISEWGQNQAEKYKERRKTMAMILLASSSLSVPPFFAITIASGTLRVPFGLFIGAGFGGIVSRYAFVAWSAMLVGDIPSAALGP